MVAEEGQLKISCLDDPYSYPIVPGESVAKTRQIHKREDVRLSEVGRQSGLRRETPIVRVLTVGSVGLLEQTSRYPLQFSVSWTLRQMTACKVKERYTTGFE